jgi:N-acetylmuramoyl-L-alanine amidase
VVLIALAAAVLCFWSNASVGQEPVENSLSDQPRRGENDPTYRMYKVIVDPGHGGQDTGSKGSGGLLEKNLTMSLARKLVQALEDTGKFRASLTRTDDQAVSLDDRAGLANHNRGDLFVSLHLGTAFTPDPTGFSIYYWSPTTASPITTTSPNIMKSWDQEQEPYWEKSRMVASLMKEELLWTIPWASGGVLAANIYVLRRTRMPSVMLELGSLTHPEEAAQLQKPEFQEAVAKALTQGIVKYRSLEDKGILIRPESAE